MGSSSSRKIESMKEDDIINKDLKKILFLFIQQKKIIDLKDKFKSSISEGDDFYLVNESLDKMNTNYNIGNIFEYLNQNKILNDLNKKYIDNTFKELLMEKYSGKRKKRIIL